MPDIAALSLRNVNYLFKGDMLTYLESRVLPDCSPIHSTFCVLLTIAA